MTKCFSKRAVSMLLALVLVLSVAVGSLTTVVSAKTGTLKANTATRHKTCTSLSAQAEAYYTGDYTWEKLSALQGGTTSCLDTDNDLFEALHTLMSSTMTNSVTYKNLPNYWKYTDGNGTATFFYSDVEADSTLNREHVWPKSHGSFVETNAGCDLHHLRPTNSTINSTRNNYTMGNVKDEYSNCETKSYGGTTAVWFVDDAYLCEVKDDVKGDVARILLYVWCRWEEKNLFQNLTSTSSGNDGIKVIESLETLLEWCALDPVDEWEMARNDQVENVQGNRNVFIDYPELAWLVFGLDVPEDITTPTDNTGVSGNPSNGNNNSNNSGSNNSGNTSTTGTTVSVTIADYADSKNWENATIYSEIKLNDDITITSSAETPSSYGQHTGKYYENGENWRIYQNETPSIVIKAADGKIIDTVTITYSDNTNDPTGGVLTNGDSQVTSGTAVSVNANSITFSVGNTGTATNGQVRITAIEVVYKDVNTGSNTGDNSNTGNNTGDNSNTGNTGDNVDNSNNNANTEPVYGITKLNSVKDGDRVLIYYPTDKKVVTGEGYTYAGTNYSKDELVLVDATVKSGVMTENAKALWLNVSISGGKVTFKTDDGKYLYADGTDVKLVTSESEYTKFVLEKTSGGYFIRCATATYNDNAQYLEVYEGYLTCYGKYDTSDASIYTFQFYAVNEIENSADSGDGITSVVTATLLVSMAGVAVLVKKKEF